MAQLIDHRGPQRREGDGLVAFEQDPANPASTRYLTVGGVPAYEAGNSCGTCEFWFTRLEGATRNVSVDAARTALANGLAALEDPVVDQLARVLAAGTYRTLLRDVSPRSVGPTDPGGYFGKEQVDLWGIDSFWGVPHDPRVPYYRVDDTPIDATRRLFEFLVPMYPVNWLDAETVGHHAARLDQTEPPTAVSLSVLDVNQPASWDDDAPLTEHWCLAHYLLDGHHKVAAAAAAGRPIRTLSFLAVDEGVSSPADHQRLLRLLGAT